MGATFSRPTAFQMVAKSVSIPIFWRRSGSYAGMWMNSQFLMRLYACISQSPSKSRWGSLFALALPLAQFLHLYASGSLRARCSTHLRFRGSNLACSHGLLESTAELPTELSHGKNNTTSSKTGLC